VSKSDAFEIDILAVLFNKTGIPNISDGGAAEEFFVSLHTAAITDPTTQSTSEIAYDGYERQSLGRRSGFFLVGVAIDENRNRAINVDAIHFPRVGSAPSGNPTYWAIGTEREGTGKVLYWGSTSFTGTLSTGGFVSLRKLVVVEEDAGNSV
jgi:hypothetical protein